MAEGETAFFGLVAIFGVMIILGIAQNMGWIPYI